MSGGSVRLARVSPVPRGPYPTSGEYIHEDECVSRRILTRARRRRGVSAQPSSATARPSARLISSLCTERGLRVGP